MTEAVISELEEQAFAELAHADLLADRSNQLGGRPVLSPDEWAKITNCGYEIPDDPFVEKILDQNIKGEQCAIRTYDKILEITKDTDPVTYNIVLGILTEEVEHEEELAALKEDLEMMLLKKQ